MKSYLFFLLLAGLLGGSAYMTAEKMGIEVPGFSFTPKIAPYSEWDSLLCGRWDFRSVSKSDYSLYVFKGKIQFNDDHTFIRNVNVKFYHNRYGPEEKLSDLRIIAGGSVTGTWKTDTLNGAVEETVLNCKIKNSRIEDGYNKNFDACACFSGKGIYGNCKEEFSEMSVKSFNNNQVEYETHNYQNDSDMTIRLKKTRGD